MRDMNFMDDPETAIVGYVKSTPRRTEAIVYLPEDGRLSGDQVRLRDPAERPARPFTYPPTPWG
jgi:hypothetical protein